MKYIGLLALCSALSMTGFYFFRLHNKRLKMLKTLSEFFFSFSRYSLMAEKDISDCIKRLVTLTELSELQFPVFFAENFFFGCDAREIWKSAVNSDKELYCLDAPSKEILLSFQECFGKIPLSVFSEKCRSYGEKFSELAGKEEISHEKNRSLFLYSGVLAAAAVFFIIV